MRGGSGSACWPQLQSRTRVQAAAAVPDAPVDARAGSACRPRGAVCLCVVAVAGARPRAGVLAAAGSGAELTRRPRELAKG